MSALIKRSTAGLRLDADPSKLLLRSVISTADADRAGDVVVPAGLRKPPSILRNPVVLWAHQRSLPPIGTCQRLDVEGDRVVAETKFAAGCRSRKTCSASTSKACCAAGRSASCPGARRQRQRGCA